MNKQYISKELLFETLKDKLDWEIVGRINELPTIELESENERNNIIEVQTNIFDRCTTITNCTVEILENTETHEISVGWYMTEDSEEIKDERK